MPFSPDYSDATMYAFLNEDLCIDKSQKVQIYNIGEMNDELTKTSNWKKIGQRTSSSLTSRWGALNG